MMFLFQWNESNRNCLRLSGQEIGSTLPELKTTSCPLWLDLEKPTDDEIELALKKLQPVHMLTLEDITRQRRDEMGRPHLPKVEEFPDYLFVIVNPLIISEWPAANHDGPITTQLAAIITHNRLITYHEQPIRAISQVRGYIERHEDQSQRGPDYVFHLILDAMVDEYAPLLDSLTERLEETEEAVFHGRKQRALPQLLHLKRRLTVIRKTLTYEREVLARMARGEFELIDDRETVYYRNVYDHLVRFTELTEASREMIADLLQMHLSVISNRLNQTMKVLTVFSSILLPMSVVVGFWGMNFPDLPWLNNTWGYLAASGVMVLSGLLPVAYLRWRRWI